MSNGGQELSALLSELTASLEQLQDELDPARGPLRPPTPRQLAQFTSEVTIPAIVLVLETNVRALRLVQRALRIAEGREATPGSSQARQRATDLGRATLSRLDEALSDLGSALESRPPDDEARELLEEVRDLQSEVDDRLETTSTDRDAVDIDVDAELQSLKDDVDDSDSHGGDENNK
ncbi:DUF7547 family protein [Salinibaculum rarum]|uniref:DUF7547 family protein n=1 Tax=Salinibaculum rarum TaxID=3058903 RepID=UPI00265E0062|nr:hypothetical protein [Salinibaculum sp. KK48]